MKKLWLKFWRRLRPASHLTLTKLSGDAAKAETSTVVKKLQLEPAKATTSLQPSTIERLGDFFSRLFGERAQHREKFSPLRNQETRTKAEAKVLVIEAKAKMYQTKADAKAAKWQLILQAMGKQCRLLLKRWTDYRTRRLARKIVHERAKTAKWREVRSAMSRIFVALRRELLRLFKWVGRLLKAKANPEDKPQRKGFGKVVWTFCMFLALVFAVVALVGFLTGKTSLWTLALWGMFLCLVVYPLFARKGFLVYLGRIVFVLAVVFWIGSWLIETFA